MKQIKIQTIVILLILTSTIFTSCEKEEDSSTSPVSNTDYSTMELDEMLTQNVEMSIILEYYDISQLYGKKYQGGYIFYINPTDGTGMVHAELSISTNWNKLTGENNTYGADSFYTLIGTSSSFGSGKENTIAILAEQGPGNYAAGLCDSYEKDGYSDWFLPSKGELDMIYENIVAPRIRGFGSGSPFFLSSSEFDFNTVRGRHMNPYVDPSHPDAWVYKYHSYSHLHELSFFNQALPIRSFPSSNIGGITGVEDPSSDTLVYGTISDIQGNNYTTVTIGNQTWMTQNLRVTSYNDGSSINSLTDEEWLERHLGAKSREGGYSWYNNDRSFFEEKYGAIYNGFAADSGKLCPQGWRIPRWSDYHILYAYIQEEQLDMGLMVNVAGAMMEKGYDHWYDVGNNTPDSVINSSGFTALPGGYRKANGEFYGYDVPNSLGSMSRWWTYSDDTGGWRFGLGFNIIYANRTFSSSNEGNDPVGEERHSGSYCRCIKE